MMLESTESEHPKQISHEIIFIFEVFQPIWLYAIINDIPQRHRRTDGRYAVAIPRSA